MYTNKYTGFVMAIVLGAVCSGMFRVAVADANDFTYQSLNDLGPGYSSRVLLMNNDTNPTNPISGQGYYDTNETATAVGGTFWWHDDEAKPTGSPNNYLNLLSGAEHVLYQKLDDNGGKKSLWTLIQCRAGAGGRHSSSADNGGFNYLPWSETCQPINPDEFSAPIEDTVTKYGASNLSGPKQIAHISMRCTTDSVVYSPFYEEGVGEIYFDVVNGWNNLLTPDKICVQVATGVRESEGENESVSQDEERTSEVKEFTDGLAWEDYDWQVVPCDMFVVEDLKDVYLPVERKNITELVLDPTKRGKQMYFRVRVRLNYRGPIRFCIRRLSSNASGSSLDYSGLIYIDNIIASYPGVSATVSPMGVLSQSDDNSENGGRANIGYVGAFTEPILSRGLEGAKPRMSFSAVTNGQPPWAVAQAEVSKASCVYRWKYLNQAYGPWKTNTVDDVTVYEGTNVIWDMGIEVPDRVGDIEYSYSAWVSGTRYRFFDFALDEKLDFPDDSASATFVEAGTNYWSRIREGVSPWQEMHLESYVITNAEEVLIATNNWTMELIGDHMWRGFVNTPTNYAGCIANIRFVGKNMWESNGVTPAVASKTWYFPIGEITEIPMGGIATTAKGDKEQDIVLDATSGYLMLEFNDESGAFTMNRAEYQDFNKWTPSAGQEENRYIGDYVNTSYVGRAKQEYTLDIGNWPLSRSSSAYWWENFDAMAGNADYPFGVPFTQVERGRIPDGITPNGWQAEHGMYINGFFSTQINNTDRGMALQMQGRGLGSLALINPADIPQGIGTINFSARLAQYIEFEDFYCNLGAFTDKNYAFSAKATMTHTPQHNSYLHRNDISTGSPSISLVAYYRPGHGCYEFRITRVWAKSKTEIWDTDSQTANGIMELAIYRWYLDTDNDGNQFWNTKNLKSLRLGGSSTTYNPQLAVGRYYTNGSDKVQYQNYFAPIANSTTPDNDNWTSVYIAAYNTGNGTYIEGAVAGKPVSSSGSGDDMLRGAVKADMTSGIMMGLSVLDNESVTNDVGRVTKKYFEKGSYGVCATECPAAFGALNRHSLTQTGPYAQSPDRFVDSALQRTSIDDGDWGASSPGRVMTWGDRYASTKVDYTGKWGFGLCAAPVSQKLHLKTSAVGDSSNRKDASNWKDAGLPIKLSSYQPTNLVFSPHFTDPCNVKISVGGDQNSPRTDVVIDDVQLSQWAADASASDFGSKTKWAFTDAWIAGTTNDVYQGAGSKVEDPVAAVSECGHYVKQLNDTEYIYVFTNTSAGALGSYATFMPKQDMILKEVFILGGGGSGSFGGGGGGGGSALWITNNVEYTAGEDGIRITVGNGGSAGSAKVYKNVTSGTLGGTGGNSSIVMKNPITLASTTYYGYGGGRGGSFRNSYTNGGNSASSVAGGGGSARRSPTKAKGNHSYASGFGGAAGGSAPGGGGGGGLRGLGSNGNNKANSNGSSVIHDAEDGADGIEGSNGGKGGDGFPLSAMGESAIRYVLSELIAGDKNADVWLGGGGGGGSGVNLPENESIWGKGAGYPGGAGKGGGGQGGQYTASATGGAEAMGFNAVPCTGGGGGGGSFNNPKASSGSENKNWMAGGGRGANGLVALHVKIKDRFVMLQPMRGSENDPMSIRTPLLNGMSLFSFSWKDAHSNAVLKVQVATNGVDESNIGSITGKIDDGNWFDFGEPIRFADMDDAMRRQGATNILMGMRAPISGVVRLLVDPSVVADARKGSTNSLDSMYGTVVITGMKVFDEPALDDRSWWGWNIMPTYREEWSSLYDPVTLGPGRSLGLNFSGVFSKDDVYKGSNPDYDPEFADDPETADYKRHDPFVQTPRFTNRIGAVMFKARVTETNLNESGWVTISACSNPGEEDDAKWDVLTNIEVTASTTVFEPFLWRIPTSQSDYQALRLTTWGAAEGRYHSEESGQPFGDKGTKNPVPVQRVLIDEVLVTQPMAPRISLQNARPFRHGTREFASIPAAKITSADEQPLLGETFGMQVQVVPAGMEDELDVESIRIYMAWYSGETPWGYKNWKDEKYAFKKAELKRASDWSTDNLVYRSHPEDVNAFIPPQMAEDGGYQIVQYHIWAEYTNKNGIEQTHEISDKDWVLPSWYSGIEDRNEYPGNMFCPYTVLDSISPKRAWFNEINTYDGLADNTKNQYIEVAVPQGFDITEWRIECIENGRESLQEHVATFGFNSVVPFKTANAVNSYAFIALQSPATKAAGTHRDLNDGTWSSTAFDSGDVEKSSPYALRLVRPTGIIEHEVVFMSTNTSTSPVSYMYDGTNLLNKLKVQYPNSDWVYAGADAYDGSLGVYTGHGESASCWTNTMKQTPGMINRMADGTPQYIDPDYFEPPSGTNLWIYANVDAGSVNSLSMVIGNVTNTSAVIIVPQNMDGSFSTSIVYVVKKWFELDRVVTNEVGKAGGSAEVSRLSKNGTNSVWTLDLSGLKLSDPESRKFEVTAFTRDSDKISNLPEGKGIAKDDPYYPAVVDWLQNYDEGDIRLAEFWSNSDNKPVEKNGEKYLLSLKQMYWLNIDPVARDNGDGNSEWALKGGMSSGSYPVVSVTNSLSNAAMTNIRCAVTMMITNLVDASLTRAPDMLRGREPGSTSYDYNEKLPGSKWNAVTFKITGALRNGLVDDIYRPLRWFTFGPDSFSHTNGYTRVIDIVDPFSTTSPGYSYEWYKHPGSSIWYRWAINDDTTNRPPITVYQLNDENALLD